MINKLLSGKTGYLLGFVACFGLVGLALVIQTHYQLNPCPLCISQRMVFMGLGVLFLIAAFINPNTILNKIFTLLQVLTAIGGAGVAIRHWWLQAHKDTMIADCGVGFDYMFENFPLKKALTLVFRGTGDCAAIDWTFLGLSLPQLGLIAFVSFGIYAIYLANLNKQ
ncbi:disulfide bond formation protein B [Methylotenera sp.]|uniref:disulfide bond formation protein B n=2 Tax=Methylotenera sp. TaxID=2051956 RepID=UPI002728D6BB|nr:disulfide bond formation protein B [Methylotenera sp.]MDO9204710.1 disulfide bond formation protein B [Methylotenera sp.]MDP2071089.1 disulfide bond formation protein B [Methylotenera sp.]MDP2231131.1 disulfide bond formation protein B [Methylotenera sp.]MDP3005963.1 disulfide bond formation protein B [Methylotenera sp.]MDP3142033.1 disulfide bond formation protein B [Methylotenera sp.]